MPCNNFKDWFPETFSTLKVIMIVGNTSQANIRYLNLPTLSDIITTGMTNSIVQKNTKQNYKYRTSVRLIENQKKCAPACL